MKVKKDCVRGFLVKDVDSLLKMDQSVEANMELTTVENRT